MGPGLAARMAARRRGTLRAPGDRGPTVALAPAAGSRQLHSRSLRERLAAAAASSEPDLEPEPPSDGLGVSSPGAAGEVRSDMMAKSGLGLSVTSSRTRIQDIF